MKKKMKEKDSRKEKMIIIVLVIIILLLLIRINKLTDENKASYWVKDIRLESYIYHDGGVDVPRSILYFNVFSNKENQIKKKTSFLGSVSSNNVLEAETVLYFRCHNKVTNDFYYIGVNNEKDEHFGFKFDVIDNPSLGNTKEITNNFIEIKNENINNNSQNIDYCEFIGMDK